MRGAVAGGITSPVFADNKTQAQEYCNLELFKAANKLSDELASYIEFYNADVDRVVANQSTVYDSGNYANLIVIGLIVVSLIASLYITIFKVVRPIRKTSKELKVIVKRYASGHADLTKRVTVKGNDEIAELASGMNVFLDTLQEVLGKNRNKLQCDRRCRPECRKECGDSQIRMPMMYLLLWKNFLQRWRRFLLPLQP